MTKHLRRQREQKVEAEIPSFYPAISGAHQVPSGPREESELWAKAASVLATYRKRNPFHSKEEDRLLQEELASVGPFQPPLSSSVKALEGRPSPQECGPHPDISDPAKI